MKDPLAAAVQAAVDFFGLDPLAELEYTAIVFMQVGGRVDVEKLFVILANDLL